LSRATASGRQGPTDSRFGFPRSLRLLKPEEFSRVFSAPRCRLNRRGVTLLARENDLGRPRLGLAIAKRHVRSAVARNRIKRQIRESFRLHQTDIGHLDVVVLARQGIEAVPLSELRAALDESWQGLAKRCKDSSSS
jgi:ribonuclease P protein component